MKTLIVAAYNNKVDMTLEFLDTMYRFKGWGNVELVLVNGGCSTKIEHPFITKRIDLDTNIGFCNTLNAGLQYAIDSDADYIFFVGNDSFPIYSEWLGDLIDLHERTGAMMTCPANDNPGMHNYNHLYQESFEDYWTADFFPSIAWLMKREDVKKIGLLDEQYVRTGMYADNDYCIRVRNAGGRIIVSKKILLRHLLSGEGRLLGTGPTDMQVNNEYFIKKWQSK